MLRIDKEYPKKMRIEVLTEGEIEWWFIGMCDVIDEQGNKVEIGNQVIA